MCLSLFSSASQLISPREVENWAKKKCLSRWMIMKQDVPISADATVTHPSASLDDESEDERSVQPRGRTPRYSMPLMSTRSSLVVEYFFSLPCSSLLSPSPLNWCVPAGHRLRIAFARPIGRRVAPHVVFDAQDCGPGLEARYEQLMRNTESAIRPVREFCPGATKRVKHLLSEI